MYKFLLTSPGTEKCYMTHTFNQSSLKQLRCWISNICSCEQHIH